ncbi:hypothetical protein AC1031_019781 [Aphanomyces cochlioides]|nr:hypothetical protein AC1031_019781 [Aphanomyces cochlioides]
MAKRGRKGGSTTAPPKRQAYYSGSSDEEESAPKQAVPLPSLENAKVRDFTSQPVVEPVSKKRKNKKQKKDQPAHIANEPEVKKKKDADVPLDERKKRHQEEQAIRSEKVVWRKFGRENTLFEQYYCDLWGMDKNEWKTLAKCLETPPCVHFRVNGTFPALSEIAKGSLETDFDVDGSILKLLSGDELELQLQPVPWVSDKSIWKINVDSKLLRKTKQLDGINTFIRDQTSIGTLVRQEPTNMLLAFYLDIHPGHSVLDIHGAGASRAAQFVELLQDPEAKNEPEGVVVINEQDAAGATNAVRMVAQTVANSSPVIVTAHKSESFPVLNDESSNNSLFDRVICSAPCSSDGAIRKFPERWRLWAPQVAYQHHAKQIELALRSLQLAKAGGLVVYSTRAFSPVENEAVIAQLLRSSACELVDVSKVVPKLQTRAGHSTWKVVNNDLSLIPSYDAASETDRRKLRLRPTMFPPTETEAAEMHLERCVRLLPHDNDTHGIFIAVLRKTKDMAPVAAGPAPAADVATTKKVKQSKTKRVGVYGPIESDHYSDLASRFGIELPSERFVEHLNFSKTRDLHYVSASVAEMLTTSAGRVNIHKAGTIAFQADKSACTVVDDGLHAILPHCDDRVVTLEMAEFTQLINSKHTWLKHLSSKAQAQLNKLKDGSVILALDESEPIQTGDTDIAVAAVKRHSSLSVTASSHTIVRIKALMLELDADDDNDDDEDGYDSMEYEE